MQYDKLFHIGGLFSWLWLPNAHQLGSSIHLNYFIQNHDLQRHFLKMKIYTKFIIHTIYLAILHTRYKKEKGFENWLSRQVHYLYAAVTAHHSRISCYSDFSYKCCKNTYFSTSHKWIEYANEKSFAWIRMKTLIRSSKL